MNKNSRIYIAGHTGMVGRSLVNALLCAGYQNLLLLTHQDLDLVEQSAVINFFKCHAIDLVIILAAKVGGIQANITTPSEFFYENAMISNHVIRAAYKAGIKYVLNIGSSCMYPKDLALLKESDLMTGVLEPTNKGYALAKLGAAYFCQAIEVQMGYHYKTLIPCNLYGPHDNFDPINAHMIPSAIRKIYSAKCSNKFFVSIWGDGQARREFMYVDDLTHCIVLAIEKGIESLPSMMNVGLGYDFTINEYYKKIAKILGYQGEFNHDLSKPVGMLRKCLDITLAKQWGWQAEYALDTGVAKTCEYFLKHIWEEGSVYV